jgi:hypothetical protein
MGDLPRCQPSAGSEDLGEHGSSEHAPRSYEAAPVGRFDFAHDGGPMAQTRMRPVEREQHPASGAFAQAANHKAGEDSNA